MRKKTGGRANIPTQVAQSKGWARMLWSSSVLKGTIPTRSSMYTGMVKSTAWALSSRNANGPRKIMQGLKEEGKKFTTYRGPLKGSYQVKRMAFFNL